MTKTIYTMWKRCETDYAALPAVRWLVKKNVQECTYGELGATITGIKKGFVAEDFSHKHIALIGLRIQRLYHLQPKLEKIVLK